MQLEKPKHLLITQEIEFKLPLAWCVSGLIVGVLTQEIVAAICIFLRRLS